MIVSRVLPAKMDDSFHGIFTAARTDSGMKWTDSAFNSLEPKKGIYCFSDNAYFYRISFPTYVH